MASKGKGLSRSVINASEEIIEHPCGFCLSRDNKERESGSFCVDCASNMCAPCTKWHADFPGMKSHQVTAISKTASGRQKKAPLPTQRCQLHHGRVIDKYCRDHKELACDSCVSLKHRLCKHMEYIPMFAKGTKKDAGFKALLDSNQRMLKDLRDTRSSQQTSLQQLDATEARYQQAIRDERDKLVSMIEERARHDAEKVKQRFQTERKAVSQNITSADTQIDATESIVKDLRAAKEDNESELFVFIKQGETTQRDGAQLLHTLRQHHQNLPTYRINNCIEKSLGQFKCLGDFVDVPVSNKPIKVKLKGDHNVNTSSDSSVCYISGVCLLPDGSFMITDGDNMSLKQLDTSYKVTRQLDMATGPSDVCYTSSNNEVAVTLVEEQKVQFVCAGASLRKTRSFTVGDFCRGICCCRGELFVACGAGKNPTGGNVRVFSLSGTPVRTIQQGAGGQNLFSVVDSISISSCGTILHVTDINKGVITTDRAGNLLTTFSDPDLCHAVGVCILDNDDLLVCGYHSHTVLHVSRDGRKLGVVLRGQDGIVKPGAVCYDCVHHRLIVTTDESDTIKVYDVQFT